MNLNEISQQISSVKRRLDTYIQELKEYKKDYEALEEFNGVMSNKSARFEEILRSKKKKISGMDSIAYKSNIARKYNEKMNSLLSGHQYSNYINNMNDMQSNISFIKRDLYEKINNAQNNINKANVEIERLSKLYNKVLQEMKNV